ncbi:uncharacterized protein LOC143848570 [Tasmannia lanceolata]|uniref:uncharacterized protein LOC143848570 n=1 Tax=Tasmannia lanceolata TaxID=3420 RepID=UPI00406497A3
MPNNLICFILFILHISISHPTSALNNEGQSLLSWLSTFNATSTSSSFFSSWNPNHQNPCNWAFITCSNNGFVSEFRIRSISLPATFPTQLLSFNSLTTLIISNANLTGEIPPSIANLSMSLTVLDLSYNALTGEIPPNIGKLSALQFLSLNSNFLQGDIPPEIGNCSNLRQLGLVDNQLTGKVPAELGHLSGLEIFRAGGNLGIHGEIPSEISNCKGLVFLGLADTSISGEIPSSFGELINLKTLSIYTANISGNIPGEIGNCSALENLFLYENQLSGEIPEELGRLKNLKKVLLWKNNLIGNIPETLGNCTDLTVMDLSLNSLTGEILPFFSNLRMLEELLLSDNNFSGRIPPFLGNFSRLKQLELDNNGLSGEIPSEIGQLKELVQFFAWNNQLHGNIPSELGNSEKLQALDLSHNFLTGSLPNSLFNLKNLTKLLLISNGFSGEIPSDIGNCTSLVRLRLGFNRFSGRIPSEISLLSSLNFLELSENQFSGQIPPEISNCTQLEMVDLHENRLQGVIPTSFELLVGLNVLDLSMNRISGPVPESLGKLTSLNKLVLNGNYITGLITSSLGLCKDLELLDLSSNRISGFIPDEFGELQGLDILLNLSWNYLSGPIPEGFSKLSKLANLDLSHNMLIGSLSILSRLENLVSLDVSYNNFSGYLPDTTFFRELPITALSGNKELCIGRDECFLQVKDPQVSKRLHSRNYTRDVIFCLVFSIVLAALFITLVVVLMIRARKRGVGREEEEEWEWEITPFQKLNFSVHDVVTRLSDSNVIGKGGSSVVYRVETRIGQVIAVKKLFPANNREFSERDSFSAEVKTLGSIRHKNIVRLLGCCSNKNTRLLMFDYISHGSLARVLHEKKIFLDWDPRYKILLGAAQGLAYLHHDCIPPIVHRDIKANNILIGLQFEAYLADFGLAKLVDSSDNTKFSNTVAGSYGYIAPEYGYSMNITEKSDVYSYGVVILEVLTGMQPTDRRLPEGTHIVNWVRKELRKTDGEAIAVLDEQLQGRPDSEIQEMLQVLGVGLLCVNPCPGERPTMKDVAALLKEIRHETEESSKADIHGKGSMAKPQPSHCNSFSRSSEPLIRTPSMIYCSSSSRVDIH